MTGCSEEYTDGIADLCQASDIDQLLRIWTIVSQVRNGDVPTISDLNLNSLAPYSDHLLLLEKVAPDIFMYIFVGRKVAEETGVDMTGKSTVDFKPEFADFVANGYEKCLSTRRPVYTRYKNMLSDKDMWWERLVLPLSRSDGHLLILAYLVPLDGAAVDRGAILEACTDGVIVLDADSGDERDDYCMRIAWANAQFKAMTGLDPDEPIEGKPLSQIFKGALSATEWNLQRTRAQRQCGAVFDMRVTVAGVRRVLRCRSALVGGRIAMVFTDISDTWRETNEARAGQAKLIHENETLHQQASELAALAHSLDNSRQSLTEEVERRIHAETRQKELAYTDMLTGVMNRRALFEGGEALIERAKAEVTPVSVVIADIDHFKGINDTWGHAAGDAVIVAFSIALHAAAGSRDIFARLGGDEFVFVVADRSLQASLALVEMLRDQVNGLAVPFGDRAITLTASFGVATLAREDDTMDTILMRADAALYDAKAAGRDRIAVDCTEEPDARFGDTVRISA
ncbi:MAG: sensor domain-containing diguanylate cyclase [Rhodobiaceae bacterium]|nr:sensor domain-containing diguanylate cyclase [Rhodobiaceae bacterium]